MQELSLSYSSVLGPWNSTDEFCTTCSLSMAAKGKVQTCTLHTRNSMRILCSISGARCYRRRGIPGFTGANPAPHQKAPGWPVPEDPSSTFAINACDARRPWTSGVRGYTGHQLPGTFVGTCFFTLNIFDCALLQTYHVLNKETRSMLPVGLQGTSVTCSAYRDPKSTMLHHTFIEYKRQCNMV